MDSRFILDILRIKSTKTTSLLVLWEFIVTVMEVSTPPTVLSKKHSRWVRTRPYNQGLSERWNRSPPKAGSIYYSKQLQLCITMFCKTWFPDLVYSFMQFCLPCLEHHTVQVAFILLGFTLWQHEPMLVTQAAFLSIEHNGHFGVQSTCYVSDVGRHLNGDSKILSPFREIENLWQILNLW